MRLRYVGEVSCIDRENPTKDEATSITTSSPTAIFFTPHTSHTGNAAYYITEQNSWIKKGAQLGLPLKRLLRN